MIVIDEAKGGNMTFKEFLLRLMENEDLMCATLISFNQTNNIIEVPSEDAIWINYEFTGEIDLHFVVQQDMKAKSST